MSEERFSSLRKLVEATLEKYEKADSLCKSDVGSTCFYSHKVNGIGCAIGCHFTSEDAEELDKIGGSIWSIYHNTTDLGGRFIIDKQIVVRPEPRFGGVGSYTLFGVQDSPLGISVDELRYFQAMHDKSEDVQDFRNRLRFFLKTGDIVASKGRFIHEENAE